MSKSTSTDSVDLQPPVQHGKSELVPTCIHLSMPLRCFESTNSRQSSGTPDAGCNTLVS